MILQQKFFLEDIECIHTVLFFDGSSILAGVTITSQHYESVSYRLRNSILHRKWHAGWSIEGGGGMSLRESEIRTSE